MHRVEQKIRIFAATDTDTDDIPILYHTEVFISLTDIGQYFSDAHVKDDNTEPIGIQMPLTEGKASGIIAVNTVKGRVP